MVRQLLLFSCAAAGCSFQAHSPAQTSSDAPSGSEPPVVIVDASVDGRDIDAPPDAKVFLDAPPVQGSLVASFAAVQGDTNLTTEGSRDWAHWGLGTATEFDHKNGANFISDSVLGGGGNKIAIGSVSSTFSWSDGIPRTTASMVNSDTGITEPSSLTITAPAGVEPRTLHVYVGNKLSTARLDVSLSDGSAQPYTSTQTAGNMALHLEYTITYNAASAGQTLTVTWTDTNDSSNGFAMLMAATLQ